MTPRAPAQVSTPALENTAQPSGRDLGASSWGFGVSLPNTTVELSLHGIMATS